MVSDPWGSLASQSKVQERSSSLEFEDNFNIELKGLRDNNYVALDDSSTYLERLQKKLDKVQGNAGTPSSQSLLAGLKSARQCQHHHLLNSMNKKTNTSHHDENEPAYDSGPLEAELPHARGLILPERQRHVDNLLLKLAPERVALAPDELVYLLSADTLDSMQPPRDDEAAAAPRETSGDGIPEEVVANTQNHFKTPPPQSPASVGNVPDDEDSSGNHFEVDFETANFGGENV